MSTFLSVLFATLVAGGTIIDQLLILLHRLGDPEYRPPFALHPVVSFVSTTVATVGMVIWLAAT